MVLDRPYRLAASIQFALTDYVEVYIKFYHPVLSVPNNFIEKMVFVLVSELLIYDYNNYSIVVHCECDGNLDVCCLSVAMDVISTP